mmetsp:Transcript_47377/g.119396  ORF Transcript_47377/g.119396 Transcript_47377/m.119396 type:complete len:203 (+) Transcript_47377:658-1266(+)
MIGRGDVSRPNCLEQSSRDTGQGEGGKTAKTVLLRRQAFCALRPLMLWPLILRLLSQASLAAILCLLTRTRRNVCTRSATLYQQFCRIHDLRLIRILFGCACHLLLGLLSQTRRNVCTWSATLCQQGCRVHDLHLDRVLLKPPFTLFPNNSIPLNCCCYCRVVNQQSQHVLHGGVALAHILGKVGGTDATVVPLFRVCPRSQ